MSFGALLFIYITKRINIPPFNNLDSMITDTTYTVVTLKGSIADIAFKVLINTCNIICFVYLRLIYIYFLNSRIILSKFSTL